MGTSALGTSGQGTPGQMETRVLVVARSSDPVSKRVAEHYAAARSISADHTVFLDLPRSEEISRETFDEKLAGPLSRWWNACPPDSRPDFIVLAKGVPHQIEGSGELTGTRASVDSELCDLPSIARGTARPIPGRRRNPYGRSPQLEFPAFSHELYGVCLVTRLDGFAEADAIALVDRALLAEGHLRANADSLKSEDGPRVLLDLNGSRSIGNDWLRFAGERLTSLPAPPVSFVAQVETTATFTTDARSLLGYAGWGSNDSRFDRGLRFTWLPGALVTTFVSSSARTFREPPSGWKPGAREATDDFEGSRQSLTADWIRSGATGAAGNAFEPYLDGCVRPQILFPAYLSGRNLAESFYLALPYLSWQSVILGDPLCAPFAQGPETSPSSLPPERPRQP